MKNRQISKSSNLTTQRFYSKFRHETSVIKSAPTLSREALKINKIEKKHCMNSYH